MSKWIGYAVSVNCGDPLGCYQGTILEADGTTITLTKAFRNGFPYPKSQVTLNAADIKDLKIIEEARLKPAEQTHSTVAVTKNNKKGQRATVCENLQANPSHSGNQQNVSNTSNKSAPSRGPLSVPTRSKPIDIQGTRNNKNNHSGSYGNAGSTPKGRTGGPFHEKARRRNEACFGDMADPALDDDFDFEGNLALFDKQALWEEMRSAARPDVVRAADDAARFRHDENVLGAAPALPAIRLPDELRGPVVYSADDGRRVPSAAPRLRRDFWDAMRRCGLLGAAHSLLARAAADVALRLAGGGRRLEARNAHQAPVAVVLAGAHRAGACGLEAARVLAAHGVRAHVLLASGPAAQDCPELRRELGALALGGVPAHASAAALPAPDVVLLALYDPLLDDAQERHAAALDWVRGARAAVVALEPPAAGWDGVCARASLLAGLPAALPPALGRVYLANVAPPAGLFRELRVAYRPPFGAASVLALD
ncbi:enhancer of mRNA-decapping protein 3 isoform X1 [Nymphalis io]|uniref:enhancer of mRNA-decapping protein 3 isoform X1 n=1 Tax=Inachis io TaxID=171585 RepID=UPI0021679D7A|nr:enhancer of mRNA-decapping protein 3 isoform X1 [Nymphalis io]